MLRAALYVAGVAAAWGLLSGGCAPPRGSDANEPTGRRSWQWQLAEEPVDLAVEADVYDIDLFNNDATVVASLHARGRQVFAYINAGAWEEYRPDAPDFPAAALGNVYEGYPNERWLDIRQIDSLAPVLRARFDLAVERGFDGIEPDNIDGYQNETGFPLTAADQLRFNRWLAEEVHARGLSIGFKNDPDQATELVDVFDWALTEDCFAEGWCAQLQPFLDAGKPVYAAEYTDRDVTLAVLCEPAEQLGILVILKRRELDAWRQTCP